MNFVDTFEVKSRENAIDFINRELSLRAVAKLTEAIERADDDHTYTVSPAGKHRETEGAIHALNIEPKELEKSLNMEPGSLDIDPEESKYSKSFTVTGSNGSRHRVYSNSGVVRIRPLGNTTAKHTADLKRHIGVSDTNESTIQLHEYHVSGTIDNKKFTAVTDDDYGSSSKLKSQNPHLNDEEIKAVHSHLNDEEFEDDEDYSSKKHGFHIKTRSGGYHGDVSDTMSKIGIE